MNKQTLAPMWDMTRQRVGILLRCIEALPADKLDSRPIPNMRTPKELVVHTIGFTRGSAESLLKGELANVDEKALVASIANKDQLLAFAKDCWAAADRAVTQTTDAQLAGMVKTPWGESYPGFVMHSIATDEFLHHRGQLYAYLRALGVEPPMNWDFEHNADGFQPKAHAAN